MNQGIEIVLPRSFEEYDDLTDFMDDAKVYLDRGDAVAAFQKSKGCLFALDLAVELNKETV